MPAGNLDAMVDGGLTVTGKMDMAPVLLYFFNKRFQENIKVVNGFHPEFMALEPELRAFRESAVAVGRSPAETLLKVGQGRLQHRIFDRRLRSVLV
jgi:hypothetical protein